MRVKVVVPVGDSHLQDVAAAAWNRFAESISLPITPSPVEFGTTPNTLNSIAFTRFHFASVALDDLALVMLSPKILGADAVRECDLTLLHECIHIHFAFGAYRDRVRAIQERGKALEGEIRKRFFNHEIDAPRASFETSRLNGAFMFVELPDEILAEHMLKRDYASIFPERAAYYLQMRQARQGETEARPPEDPFKALSFFYLHLTCRFFADLTPDLPQVRDPLNLIAEDAARRFRELGQPDLVEACMREAEAAIDVSLECDWSAAAAACERIFQLANGDLVQPSPQARAAGVGSAEQGVADATEPT